MADLKIYKMDEYSWYVAHNLMEFLTWYDKNIDSIETPYDLSELEEADINTEGMWTNEGVTPEDIEELGESDKLGVARKMGSLRRVNGEIYKFQSFAQVLGGEDIKEPYEIATTEW